MNIGDRVRFIHSTEEGIIAKVLDSQMVEVEIEDGFQIPAMKSELTLISREEKIWFSNKKNTAVDVEPISNPQKKSLFTYQGIYTGFIPNSQSQFNLFLINNTDYELLTIVGIEKDLLYQTLTRSILEAKSCIKLQDLTLQNIELWGTYIFQFLFYKVGNQGFKEPLTKRVRFRKSTFNTTLKQVPVLLKDGFFLQLDDAPERTTEEFIVEKNPAIDVQRLKEAMFESKSLSTVSPMQIVPKPSKEVDLHIEKLTQSSKSLDNLEMLTLQIQSFEKNLENAIANGMKDIIFIHGVGNGKLKTEIHRRLSKNPLVKFFEEARKEKFGYGATHVQLK
jgi:Smr domain/Domain of unknown function (DUF2027)